MNIRISSLAALALALVPLAGNAQQSSEYGQLKWSGSIYAKFLDGNRRNEYSLSNSFDTTPGEQGGDQARAWSST